MVNKKRHDTNGMHMLQTEARDQENQEKWTAFHQRRTILKAHCRHIQAHKRETRAYSFPDSARNKWPPAAKPTSRKWHPNLPKQQKKGWLILVAVAPTSTCWRALHPNLLVPIPPSGHHAASSDWCRDLILVRSTHGHRWPNPNLTGVITSRSAPKKLRIASEMDL